MKQSRPINNTSLADKLVSVPAEPGCYLYRDRMGNVIYVGKAVNLRNRVRSYFQKGSTLSARIRRMVRLVYDAEWIVTDTEIEALILESTLIKKHRPHFNIRLRDDKSYPYVCVTINDPYPRVFFTRRPHLKRDNNLYYGPFTDARSLRDSLRMIRKIFGIQSCRPKFTGEEKLRPCLYFHLNQCLGPCTGEMDQMLYHKAVKNVCKLFEGRHDEIITLLESQMEEAAENMQFERAATLRDRIRAISRLADRQKVISPDLVDQDIIGLARKEQDAVLHVFFIRTGRLIGQENFSMEVAPEDTDASVVEQFIKQYYEGAGAIPAELLSPVEPDDKQVIEDWLTQKRGKRVKVISPQRGEKRHLVEMVGRNAQIALEQRIKRGISGKARGEQACLELGDVLGMEMPPVRIECYDISNLQGGYAVGSMVVFEDGLPAKKEYRHFRIRTVEGQDDFASMKEVISRRLAKARSDDSKFGDMPDLMLIDGGKGQLSAAMEAVREAGEEGFTVASLAKREEEIFLPGVPIPMRLQRHSSALQLLQHIRDEAHRFAVSYHRKLRGKGSLHSELDNIPGIGPTRRNRLIKTFGSLEEIRKLTPEQLAEAPGMTAPVARDLYAHLHGEAKDEKKQNV